MTDELFVNHFLEPSYSIDWLWKSPESGFELMIYGIKISYHLGPMVVGFLELSATNASKDETLLFKVN